MRVTDKVAVERNVLKNLIELARTAIELDNSIDHNHLERGRYVCPAAMKMVREFAKEFDEQNYREKEFISFVQEQCWGRAVAISDYNQEACWTHIYLDHDGEDGSGIGEVFASGQFEHEAWKNAAEKMGYGVE